MRYIVLALVSLLLFVVVTAVTVRHDERLDPVLYEYVTANFRDDTSARNAVAAVLLNYRMYDTLLEALILLTAIIGMLQFLPGYHGEKGSEDSGERDGGGNE